MHMVLDPHQIPLLNPLNRQRRNERRTHPAPILRAAQHNRIALPLRPVQNLPQRLRAPLLEVRILVEHASVGANMAALDVLLLADGGDATGGEARGARADELGKAAAELELGARGVDAELGGEEFVGLGEVLEGVFFDEGEEGCVQYVRFLERADVLLVE